MEKPVFIINGFLDSGKTSFIQETLSDPQFAEGGRVLVLMCEEGEEEYDEAALAKQGISVLAIEELSQLTTQFMMELDRFYKPHMVLIEFNGMWKLEEFLDVDMPDDWALAQIISLADASTFPMYMKNMRSVMLDQVRYSDLVIFNRCDDDTDKMTIRRQVKAVNRRAQIIYEREDGLDTGEEEEELPYDLNEAHLDISDEDYGIWYLDAMDHPDQYVGKSVRFLAMTYVSNKLPKGYFVPGRMAMTCCEDDVAFIGMLAKPPIMLAEKLRSRQWYYVTATMTKEVQKEYQGEGPVLLVTKLEPAEEPAEKMIYMT